MLSNFKNSKIVNLGKFNAKRPYSAQAVTHTQAGMVKNDDLFFRFLEIDK
jgi:hypothetical protein